MNNKKKTVREVLFVIALLLTNVIFVADMAIIPIFPQFYTDFGDNIGLTNFIVSGPMLVMVIGSLMTGKLMQLMSKKMIIIIGAVLFAISANLCIAVYNIYYIAAMRMIYGFSYGMVVVAAYALIAQVYEDEKSRGNMMGVYTAFAGVFGILLGIVGGQLAAVKWQSAFQIYWVAIPIVILLILFIPKTEKDPISSKNKVISEVSEKINPKTLAPLCISFFILNAVFCIFYYQIGFYVVENNIGDSSIIGMLAAVETAGAFISSMLFGQVYEKMKRATIIPSYVLFSISFILMYLAPNFTVSLIAIALLGVGYGNGLSYFLMRPTVIVPPTKIGTSLSIVNAVNGLGAFASTFLATALMGALNVNTLTGIIPVLAGICAIGAVLSVILTVRSREYQANEATNEAAN